MVQKFHERQKERAREAKNKAIVGSPGAVKTGRKARRKAAVEMRKLATSLPKPLHCKGSLQQSGTVVRSLQTLVTDHYLSLAICLLMGLAAVIYHNKLWLSLALGAGSFSLLYTLLRGFLRDWSPVRSCQVRVHKEALLVKWASDDQNVLWPLNSIVDVDVQWNDAAVANEKMGSRNEDKKSPANVILRRDSGATLTIETSLHKARALNAAISVAAAALKIKEETEAALEPQSERAPQADGESKGEPVKTPHVHNEAALSVLDREGRSTEDWRRALKSTLIETGYRRVPPLSPDQLIEVAKDENANFERRIGAALALSERSDEHLRGRLRICVDSIAFEPLRIAMERAAEGDLNDDILEEAIAREESLPRRQHNSDKSDK